MCLRRPDRGCGCYAETIYTRLEGRKHADMHDPVSIYVYLLDEGTHVWRPVEAVPLEDGSYRIVSDNLHPDDERWQFVKGDVVRCIYKTLHDTKPRECLVAIEKVEGAD